MNCLAWPLTRHIFKARADGRPGSCTRKQFAAATVYDSLGAPEQSALCAGKAMTDRASGNVLALASTKSSYSQGQLAFYSEARRGRQDSFAIETRAHFFAHLLLPPCSAAFTGDGDCHAERLKTPLRRLGVSLPALGAGRGGVDVSANLATQSAKRPLLGGPVPGTRQPVAGHARARAGKMPAGIFPNTWAYVYRDSELICRRLSSSIWSWGSRMKRAEIPAGRWAAARMP